jgi:hypothetical protein
MRVPGTNARGLVHAGHTWLTGASPAGNIPAMPTRATSRSYARPQGLSRWSPRAVRTNRVWRPSFVFDGTVELYRFVLRGRVALATLHADTHRNNMDKLGDDLGATMSGAMAYEVANRADTLGWTPEWLPTVTDFQAAFDLVPRP